MYGIVQEDALLSYIYKTLVIWRYTYITWKVDRGAVQDKLSEVNMVGLREEAVGWV